MGILQQGSGDVAAVAEVCMQWEGGSWQPCQHQLLQEHRSPPLPPAWHAVVLASCSCVLLWHFQEKPVCAASHDLLSSASPKLSVYNTQVGHLSWCKVQHFNWLYYLAGSEYALKKGNTCKSPKPSPCSPCLPAWEGQGRVGGGVQLAVFARTLASAQLSPFSMQ